MPRDPKRGKFWDIFGVVYALAIGLALIVLPIIAPLMIIMDGFEKAWDENAAMIVLAIVEVLCILIFIIAVNLTDERRKKIGRILKAVFNEFKPIICVLMIFGGGFVAVHFTKEVFANEYSRSKNQSMFMLAVIGAVCALLPPYLMLNKTVNGKSDIKNNEADEVKEPYRYIKIGEYGETGEDDEFDEYDEFGEDDEFVEYDELGEYDGFE